MGYYWLFCGLTCCVGGFCAPVTFVGFGLVFLNFPVGWL